MSCPSVRRILEKRGVIMGKYKKRICIALVVILIASFFAWGLQTGFHSVRVRDIYLLTEKQQQLHALAFVPRNASAENQLPCVVTGHGGFHSAEMQDAACIELSRRGVVVIAIDMYSHGMSSNVPNFMVDSIFMGNGMGIGDMVNYVKSGNLDFVDTSRVAIMGHSMGTLACSAVLTNQALKYENAILAAQDAESDGGEEITAEEQATADAAVDIIAAFCEGMAPDTLAGTWEKIHGINVAFEYGIFEELNVGTGHLLDSPGALEMINTADPSVTVVENGKYYGSVEDGTLRVFYQPKTTHLTDFIAPVVTAEFISFFTDVFGLETTLSPTNHVYLLKECFNLIALVALLSLIVPVGALLLDHPIFAGLKADKLSEPKGDRKKFFKGLGFCALFSLIGFFVSNAIDTKAVIFKPGPLSNAKWFPLNEANIVMVWMLIFAIGNIIWYVLQKKTAGETDNGLKIGGKPFGNTLGLAVAIVTLIFVVVWFDKWMFNVDFRFWKVAVKQFNNEKLIYFLQYWPVWLLFMVSASLLTNGPWDFGSEHEFKDLLMIGIGLCLGGIIVWCLQYGKLFLTETCMWSNMNGVASVALRNWILIFTPFMLRKFYRMTGKNWLGPLTLSIFCTLISVNTTTIQQCML